MSTRLHRLQLTYNPYLVGSTIARALVDIVVVQLGYTKRLDTTLRAAVDDIFNTAVNHRRLLSTDEIVAYLASGVLPAGYDLVLRKNRDARVEFSAVRMYTVATTAFQVRVHDIGLFVTTARLLLRRATGGRDVFCLEHIVR